MNIEIAKKRINEVIKTDVVTSSKADFMATHVPLRKIKVINDGWNGIQSNRFTHMSENEIFVNYVRNKDNKHQFVIVKGSNGVGKSHLIRWMATNLEKENDPNEEMLFIRRSDNNLKRTIEQLLSLDAVSGIPDKDILERLVKAATTIDDIRFKNDIYNKFISISQSNTDTKILRKSIQDDLVALLQNDLFKTRLCEVGGSIDRIFSKVADKLAIGNNEIIALFTEEDFKIDLAFCEELTRQGADRKAISMAEYLNVKPQKIGKVVEFLNGFVDEVIQSTAGIKPGDFEKIFFEIRKELKRMNKNLTLFIEDITSFTGVNEALLNVLATEHTGDYEKQEICRITSFVGTTIPYYESFEKNFMDRITTQIEIEDNPFGQNENELFEFAGKYLNAMSLDREQIEHWISNGAEIEEYPIHIELQGDSWDHFEIEKGKRVSLYPFTFSSIRWLYSILEKKTPRYLLKNIIEPVMNDVMTGKNCFPEITIKEMPKMSEADSSILASSLQKIYADDVKMREKQISRLEKFIRVWGDATLGTEEKNGITYLAGLPIHIFKEFEMPIISGRKVKPGEKQIDNIGRQNATNGGGTSNVVPTPSTLPKPSALSREEKEYQELIKDVDNWLQGGTFEKFKDVRDNINNFLYDSINWQNEGVSYDSVIRLRNSQYSYLVSFERQKANADNGLIILQCNSTTANVIRAFLAWQYSGKKKWSFEGATYLLYTVQSWYYSIKDTIVEKVKRLAQQDCFFDIACAAEIYRMILFGQYKGTTLSTKYITPEVVLENKVIDYRNDNQHSKAWSSLMENMYKRETKNIKGKGIDSFKTAVKYFYNLYQGDIGKDYNDKVFLDYSLLESRIKTLLKAHLVIDYPDTDRIEIFAKTRELIIAEKENEEAIKYSVVPEELKLAKEYIEKLKKYFGTGEIFDDDVEEICTKSLAFYKNFAKQNFNINSQSDIIKLLMNEKTVIANAIETVNKAFESNDYIEVLMLFSQDPIKRIKKLTDFLEILEIDVKHMETELSNRKNQLVVDSNILRSEIKQTKINEIIEKTTESLKKWREYHVN